MRFREEIHQEHARHAPRKTKKEYAHVIEDVNVDDLPEHLSKILASVSSTDEFYLSHMLKKVVLEKGAPEARIAYHLPWFIGIVAGKGDVDKATRPWKKITEVLEIEEMRIIGHDLRKP